MPRTPLRRVAEGIYRGSKTSLTAVVTVGTWPDMWRVEQPFDLDTPLSEIQAWRDDKTRPTHVANTLIARTEKRLRARLDAYGAELGERVAILLADGWTPAPVPTEAPS